MNIQRWLEIERDGKPLTQEEIKDGWFFCCDWDNHLIHKTGQEAPYCTCLAKKRLKGEIE